MHLAGFYEGRVFVWNLAELEVHCMLTEVAHDFGRRR
jgi:hypothetical protein